MRSWKSYAEDFDEGLAMSEEIKRKITDEIISFVADEGRKSSMKGIWQEPLVGFADVNHSYIRRLRDIVHKEHQMPEQVIADASIVIVYFVPFGRWIPRSNNTEGLASPQWAQSYEETNAMFGRLNEHIIRVVHKMGYEAGIAPEAHVFYRDEVISHWSFRHFAYAAGLGTFGLNNMLITEKGCAGRVNTVVTNLDVKAGEPKKDEACLYKRNGTCGLCVSRCPSGALTKTGFDRHRCFEQCLENAGVYTEFGNSYASKVGEEAADSGSEVCGKCLVGLPCTYKIP